MTTTTHPRAARPNHRSRRIAAQTALEWVCILLGGILASCLITNAINAASAMLGRG